MIAYKFDKKGFFSGVVECQLDPLASAAQGKEVYLLPANSTFLEPLGAKDGFEVKFNGSAWIYEKVYMVEPTAEELKIQEIAELKNKLAISDYAVIKIAEGAATHEEYADLITQRQAWRARINELEGE